MAKGGSYTVDHVPAYQLYQEFLTELALYIKQQNAFMSLFCTRTTQRTLRISQRTAQMKPAGQGTAPPEVDHTGYIEITLNEAIPYEVAVGVDKKALEKGLTAEQVRDSFSEVFVADTELIQQLVLKSCMDDGGWWDAAMTAAPPNFKSYSFATSHDHYLAYNVAGVATFAHVSAIKQHIVEHGYGYRGIIGFWNSAMAERWAQYAEPVLANAWPSSMLDAMQKLGVPEGNAFLIDGIPWIIDEWIPDYYMLAVDATLKPLRWRDPDGLGVGAGLVLGDVDDFVEKISQARRWGAVTVGKRGAGVVAYLNSATYTAPSHWTVT